MPPTVGALIDAVRDLHPAFDPDHHPPAVLVRAFTAAHAELLAQAIARNPEAVSSPISLNASEIAEAVTIGHTLPAHLRVVPKGSLVGNDGVLERFSIMASPFTGWGRFGWVEDGLLKLSGELSEWTDVKFLRLRLVLNSPEFAQRSDLITLPPDARAALVNVVAATLARRAGVMVEAFVMAAQQSVADFLLSLAHQRTSTITSIRAG